MISIWGNINNLLENIITILIDFSSNKRALVAPNRL